MGRDGLVDLAVRPVARATSAGRAASETTSDAAPTRSAMPASVAVRTVTRARLRKDLTVVTSSAATITSAGIVCSHPASSSAACLVAGASRASAASTASDPRAACSDSALRSAARRALRLTLKV